MAAVTTVVLTDRTPVTAVDHTFIPNGFSADRTSAFWKKSATYPVGDYRLSLTKKETASKRRLILKLVLPVTATETINGVDNPKVVRAAYATVEFNFDSQSSEQERKDCIGMIADALAADQTGISDTIVNLNSAY